MMIAILAVLGLCLGSFVNALVWRLHEKKNWVSGRSECVNCSHQLGYADLIPVVSWLALRGKCRYCQAPISKQYPLVELALGVVFAASYYFWPVTLSDHANLVLFATWLIASVGLMALLIYDMRYMLLPNKLIYPVFWVSVLGNFIFILMTTDRLSFAVDWLLSILVASGIFFVLHEISKGKWVGFGDVRLGLITGTLLHSPAISFLMLFVASLLGTAFILPSMISKKRGWGTRLPFGPFLIAACMICLLFGQRLLDAYLNLVSI